jgi:hypothetical protein
MNQEAIQANAEGHGEHAGRMWLDLDRVRVYSAAVLFLFILLMVTWAWHSHGFTDSHISRPGADFAVFWSASYLALTESPLQAYDVARHIEVMASYGPLGIDRAIILPWLYPPTFLLVVLPLATLPLAVSYLLFVTGSVYAYLRTVGGLLGGEAMLRRGAWLPVVASPAVLLSVILGQNSLLTASLAGGAVCLLNRRPVLAGVLIGMLAVKPQLALLIPVALIAGRHMRALASAVATAAAFAAVSVAICGWETIPAFLHSLAWARANLMEGTSYGWYGMPSVLAAAQLAGLSHTAAYAVQGLVALAAAAAVAYVWSRTREATLCVAVLAAAALLATPYVRHYELTWLGIAVAGLVGDGLRHGLSGRELALFLVVWWLPVFEAANPVLGMPQIGPVVSALLVIVAVRRTMARTSTAPVPATAGT